MEMRCPQTVVVWGDLKNFGGAIKKWKHCHFSMSRSDESPLETAKMLILSNVSSFDQAELLKTGTSLKSLRADRLMPEDGPISEESTFDRLGPSFPKPSYSTSSSRLMRCY